MAKKRTNPGKGASFERRACKSLSIWVSGGLREDVFWRSAMSGGRASLASRRKGGRAFNAQSGDITAIHKSGHALLHAFVLECKHVKDLNMMRIVRGRTGHLFRFWKKLKKECKAAGKKLPMMIARQNRYPDLLITNAVGAALLMAGRPDLRIRIVLPTEGMYSFLFRDILTDLDFKAIKKHCKNWPCQDFYSQQTSTSRPALAMPTVGKSSPISEHKPSAVRLRLPLSSAT